MENNYAADLGTCRFCGAKMVKSPKTGKVFCSEKCWLKKSESYTPNEARDVQIQENIKNKDTGIKFSATRRDAVAVTTALMGQGGAWTDEMVKTEINKWIKYFTEVVYADKPF